MEPDAPWRASLLVFHVADGKTVGLAAEMMQRFGFPSDPRNYKTSFVWRGAGIARLVVQVYRRLKIFNFPEESGLFLADPTKTHLERDLRVDDEQ